MALKKIVLDTNVVESSLRSRLGASYQISSNLRTNRFRHGISVPLYLEYEYRVEEIFHSGILRISEKAKNAILRALAFYADEVPIYYKIRPDLNVLAGAGKPKPGPKPKNQTPICKHYQSIQFEMRNLFQTRKMQHKHRQSIVVIGALSAYKKNRIRCNLKIKANFFIKNKHKTITVLCTVSNCYFRFQFDFQLFQANGEQFTPKLHCI